MDDRSNTSSGTGMAKGQLKLIETGVLYITNYQPACVTLIIRLIYQL
nr:hypothetical protein [Fredinandcohnia onubensis]